MKSIRIISFILVLLFALPAVVLAQATGAPPPDSTVRARRPGLGSWTTDRRDFHVGDVVTILVDELTIASAEKSNVDSKNRGTNAGLGYRTPGAAGAGGDVDFRTRLDTESAARGKAGRRDVLTTELSARIVAIEPGGTLKIEGTRTLLIDKNEQRVTLTGIARAQDISPRNVIESWRLADAELSYQSKGGLANPKQGILTRILGMLWP